MNFLAHLVLAGDDDGLRLGAMLGDFVRGRSALKAYPESVQLGILLHRHIDATVDTLPIVEAYRNQFPTGFRRYAGIITDLLYDHELAGKWSQYRSDSLESFDRGVRQLLHENGEYVPDRLQRFMVYADRRGLFESYREKSEILRALTGLGKRLKRANPLHRVDEIWDDVAPGAEASFDTAFSQIQSDVEAWLKSRSTMTGL